MKTNSQLKEMFRKESACAEGVRWVGERDEKQMLADFERGDWCLWYFWRMRNTPGYPDVKVITLVKVKCARLVQHLMKDQRSINALDVAERWANGEVTDDQLADAADAAADAAAYAAYAADAAAAYAAYAAYAAAAYAAYAAYAAAAAAAYAADAADAADDARAKIQKQCADICREVLWVPE